MKNDIEVGREYYFIHFTNKGDFPGGQFNMHNYEIIKGKVAEIKDTILVETSEYGIVELTSTALFKEYADAENYRIHLTFI